MNLRTLGVHSVMEDKTDQRIEISSHRIIASPCTFVPVPFVPVPDICTIPAQMIYRTKLSRELLDSLSAFLQRADLEVSDKEDEREEEKRHPDA